MLRVCVALVAALFLSACAEHVWAPDDKFAAAQFSSGEPPSITLLTSINDRTGSGAHSGLMVNASQRVLFDPAGTFQHPSLAERGDVFYGMTDRMVWFYRDYHGRNSATEQFHLVEQKVYVSAEIAELVLRKVAANGAVPKAQCANSISGILRDVPGFESIRSTWFPKKLSDNFAKLPNVETQIFTEENDNPGAGHGVVLVDKKGNKVN